MGSPLQAMLGNAAAGGGVDAAIQEQCGKMSPQQRAASGICPPETPMQQPPDGGAAAAAQAQPGLPQVPDYAGIAETLQRTPMMSEVLPAPAVAGGQKWMDTQGAANAYQQPSIADVLSALFGGR